MLVDGKRNRMASFEIRNMYREVIERNPRQTHSTDLLTIHVWSQIEEKVQV